MGTRAEAEVATALPRRPPHQAAPQQMQMQVIDALPGLWSAIDGQSIPVPADPPLFRDPVGHIDHPEQQAGVLSAHVTHRRDVFLRHDQYVDRRSGTDVLKGEDLLVPEHFFGIDLLLEDLAEETVLGQGYPPAAAIRPSVQAAYGRTRTRSPTACPAAGANTLM